MSWESGIQEDWRRNCIAKCTYLRGVPRRTVLTPNLHHGRQDLSNPKARTSADHQSKRSEGYEETRSAKFEETRSGNIDFRIQGLPHPAVQKEDYDRREMVNKLIHQFDTHPNRDSLMEDLNKTEEFNQFSEKSKELITSMGNTEYLELCEISSKIPWFYCSLYWEVGIVYCTCGKCLQPSERKIDTMSCQSPVSSFLRIRSMEPDMDQLCGRKSSTKHDTSQWTMMLG